MSRRRSCCSVSLGWAPPRSPAAVSVGNVASFNGNLPFCDMGTSTGPGGDAFARAVKPLVVKIAISSLQLCWFHSFRIKTILRSVGGAPYCHLLLRSGAHPHHRRDHKHHHDFH